VGVANAIELGRRAIPVFGTISFTNSGKESADLAITGNSSSHLKGNCGGEKGNLLSEWLFQVTKTWGTAAGGKPVPAFAFKETSQ